jgi:hypothetical protein
MMLGLKNVLLTRAPKEDVAAEAIAVVVCLSLRLESLPSPREVSTTSVLLMAVCGNTMAIGKCGSRVDRRVPANALKHRLLHCHLMFPLLHSPLLLRL